MLTSEEQQNDKPSTSTTKAAVAGREVKKPIKWYTSQVKSLGSSRSQTTWEAASHFIVCFRSSVLQRPTLSGPNSFWTAT